MEALIGDHKAVYTRYANLRIDALNAWETQQLYQATCMHYLKAFDLRLARHRFVVQNGWTYDRFAKDVPQKSEPHAWRYHKGDADPATFRVIAQSTPLTQALTYLSRFENLDSFDAATLPRLDPTFQQNLVRLQRSDKWERIKTLVLATRVRVARRINLIVYKTSTHTLHPKISRCKLVMDNSNGQYQVFLQLRKTPNELMESHARQGHGLDGKPSRYWHLPVLWDRKRLDLSTLRDDAQFQVKMQHGKLHVLLTHEAPDIPLPPFEKALALDVGQVHLMADNEGRMYSHNTVWLDVFVAALTALQNGPLLPTDYRYQAMLRRLLRRNEAEIQRLLSGWLDAWQAEGVSDLILEDLSLANDATVVRHPLLDVRYSALNRLMRLSAIKGWLASMCRKRGMRLHLTDPAYTSQECNICHHISGENRSSQAQFACVRCGHTENADTSSAKTMMQRFTSNVLKHALHQVDNHHVMTPKALSRRAIKEIIVNAYAGGPSGLPVPEPLPSG